jgi:hypothetical protein
MTELKYRDQTLAFQPYHDTIRRFETMCRAKNISVPFSEAGFESVLQVPGLLNALTDGMASEFNGQEDLKTAYKNCVKHTIAEHHNKFTAQYDIDGNAMGLEGYGPTAVAGSYNTWTRLSPVLTAGYLARSRSLELFQIMHEDKPTFWRQYTVTYIQKGLEGERLVLPKAIRAGRVGGLLDLPLCEPVESGDNPNISNVTVGEKTVNGMIAVGTTGNILEQSPFGKAKNALELHSSIDAIHVVFKDNEDTDVEAIVNTRIERELKTGKTSERLYNEVVTINHTNPDESIKRVQFRVMALIDLDTGNYHVMDDGTGIVKHIHFKIRVTNTANEMETVMNGIDQYTMSFDVENKIYGSIIVIPEMTADFNAGGEGVSWVAYMTDNLTETYAGIRDNDLENFVEEQYNYSKDDFELAFKLNGFKLSASYPIIPRHAGGSDDILGPQRLAFKHFITRILARSDKATNFDKNVERQWILMANDEDVDILPEIQWQTNSAEFTGGEGSQSFRYGFSLDDAYGWLDNFGRKVRVIGSRDERWLGRPIWGVLKTTTLAAPTLLYFPYMFRTFSSISPDMRNRPALLFASRDAKRCSTMVQIRISLEGNDLAIYPNSALYTTGFPNGEAPAPRYSEAEMLTVNEGVTYGPGVFGTKENIPNVNPTTGHSIS